MSLKIGYGTGLMAAILNKNNSKSMRLLLTILFFFSFNVIYCQASTRSINGLTQWRTGYDAGTVQLLPVTGVNGLTKQERRTVAHATFKVNKYGEMSFPINPATPINMEALPVDLRRSRFIKVKYRPITK
jgi:hypothetical protein